MRRGVDADSLFYGAAVIAVRAEKLLDLQIPDSDLESLRTIADVESLLRRRLGRPIDASSLEPLVDQVLAESGAEPPFDRERRLIEVFGGSYLECRWEPDPDFDPGPFPEPPD